MIRYLLIILMSGPMGLYAQEASNDTTASAIATLGNRTRNAQARYHYQQAEALEREGDNQPALDELNQALALKHDHEEALWLRAQVKRNLNDYSGSLTDYQALLYLNPEMSEARFERAQLLYRLERYESAINDLIFLLENSLGETNTVYFRGGSQTVNGTETFVAQSATTVQSGIKSDIWNILGLCHLELKNYSRAITNFELALTQTPEDPNLYSNLGLTAERSGDTLQAIQYYHEALVLHPNHSVALHNFSNLTRKTNRLDLAEAALNNASDGEDSPQRLLHQGMILHQQGKYQQAISRYDQAILRQPSEADFYLQRAFTLEKINRLDRALQDYNRSLDLNPFLEKAYVNRGNVYYKQNQPDLAILDYQQALKLDSGNAKTYYNLGLAYHRLDAYPEACANLERALQLGYLSAESIIKKVCQNP